MNADWQINYTQYGRQWRVPEAKNRDQEEKRRMRQVEN